MKITQDMHVHTQLSLCSNDPAQNPAAIIADAAAKGLKNLCFTDHFWDRMIPGATEWYAEQDLDHHNKIFAMLPEDTRGIRVMVGCECEFCGGDRISISPEAMAQMDFINVPIDHFHMKDFVCPASVQTADQVRDLYLTRFREVLELPLPWEKISLAHPTDILSFGPIVPDVLNGIPDAVLGDIFARCAALGTKLEINTSLQGTDRWSTQADAHIRFFALARECGCLFTFGSDAHFPDDLGTLELGAGVAVAAGIPEEQIFDPATLPLHRG